MKTFIRYVCLLLTTFSIVVAQIDTTLKDYFPMEIGNVWEYEEDMYPDYWRYQIKTTRDTVMPNGKKYLEYFFKGEPIFTKYYRMDDSLNIYSYGSGYCYQQEILMFKLGVKDRNFWEIDVSCVDTVNVFIGLYGSGIRFYPQLFQSFDTKLYTDVVIKGNDTIFSPLVPKIVIPTRLAKGVGIIWTQFEGPASNLVGAIINGKKIGNITSVKQVDDNNQFPQTIEIKNYPNPFNSTTSIKFQLVKSGVVKLNIYNSIGQTVESRDIGYLAVGEHSFVWDAGVHSSGIYFYEVIINNFIQQKKMVLLR